jgi:hypothetical protein
VGLIRGDEEAWLLVAGSATDLAGVIARLRSAGIEVIRSGRYLGGVTDGFAADWYARFALPVDITLLETLLHSQGGASETIPSSGEDDRALRLRLIQAELAEARAREASLASDLARLKLASALTDDDGAEAAALRQTLAEEQRLHAEAGLARAAAEQERDFLANRPAATPGRAGQPKFQNELAVVMETLLPKLKLVRDTLTVLAVEFSDRRAVFRALGELQGSVGRLPSGWKAVQGAEEWWERHISDGRDNTGRLYCRLIPSSQSWAVLVSYKAIQKRDIAWIKNCSVEV